MYQFSRSIYRELAPKLGGGPEAGCASKQRVLSACESTMQRLLTDRRYFAHPTKTLFTEVRNYFPINEQLFVYRVVDRNVRLALRYLDTAPDEELALSGERECRAHTRRGTPCQREPLPGCDYCPSHKHLEEELGPVAEAPAESPAGAEEHVALAA